MAALNNYTSNSNSSNLQIQLGITYNSTDFNHSVSTTLALNTTTHKDPYENFYNSAKEVTGLYLFPIICIIGILGNSLTLVVFIKFKPRSSTNVYLTTLALSDTIKLLCDLLYFVVVVTDKLGHKQASVHIFKTLYPYAHYCFNFSLCNTAWLTVSVAVERYIYMKWPERARTICSITRAKITCCVVWIIAMIITIPFALRYRTGSPDIGNPIVVTPLWKIDKFTSAYVWTQNIIRSGIPLVVLIILNTWIIWTLTNATKQLNQRPLACKNRVTVMLVAVIISFLICITPDAILSTLLGFGYTDGPFLVRGIREISDLLLVVNSAINFFIYIFLNKVFRENFARVFCTNYYYERLAQKDDGVT